MPTDIAGLKSIHWRSGFATLDSIEGHSLFVIIQATASTWRAARKISLDVYPQDPILGLLQ
jgi:hypothetical protein